MSRSHQGVGGLKSVGSAIGISICRLQRPNPAARCKLASVRCDPIRRFTMELVGAIGVNFPHPQSAVYGELPFSDGIGIDAGRISDKRTRNQGQNR